MPLYETFFHNAAELVKAIHVLPINDKARVMKTLGEIVNTRTRSFMQNNHFARFYAQGRALLGLGKVAPHCAASHKPGRNPWTSSLAGRPATQGALTHI